MRTGMPRISSANSGMPSRSTAPPVRTAPAESCSSMPVSSMRLRIDGEDLFDARLDDVDEDAARGLARRVAADAGDLDLFVVADHASERAAGEALEAIGLGHRRAKARGDVARDVVAADGDDARVRDAAVDVEQDVGRAAADVDRPRRRFLSRRRREPPRRSRAASSTTSATARPQRSAQRMTFCTQLVAAVTRFTFTPRRTPLIPIGSRMPSCAVDDVLARQDVEDLAIGVDRDRARAFEDALDVGARDLAAGDGRDAVATSASECGCRRRRRRRCGSRRRPSSARSRSRL